MLQLIGWLGCLYLVVKGFELAGSQARGEPISTVHGIGASLAWLGAVVFALLIYGQGKAPLEAFNGPNPFRSPPSYEDTFGENVLATDPALDAARADLEGQ